MLLKHNIFALDTFIKKTKITNTCKKTKKMTMKTCIIVLSPEWKMLHVSTTELQKTAKRHMELSEEKIYFILLKLDKFK